MLLMNRAFSSSSGVKVAQLSLVQQALQMPRVPAQPFNPDVHEGGQIVVHSGFIRAAPDGKEKKHGKTEGNHPRQDIRGHGG
ncbi:MAG: hypothetical protein BHW66_06900 [Akkermansia sp. 54_46]|nr:MAG: hypothetical protein BHW66_06900 [Akkermansia sp. 54_46]